MGRTMTKLLFLAIGGATGAVLRYSVSLATARYMGEAMPWGTLMVNVIGAFCIGVLSGLFEGTDMSHNMKLLLFVGLLGAFTTFSAYSLESFNLFREGQVKMALSNILINNAACITMVFTGFLIASSFKKF